MTVSKKNIEPNIDIFTVSNGKISFSAMNFGCTLTEIIVPDKNGNATDILLGFDDLEGYKKGEASHNAIVGRVANRISSASFKLNGKTYALDKNDGEKCLHGGFNRFEKMVWDAESFSGEKNAGVKFSRKSASLEQGFPGNVEIEVVYSLDDENKIRLEYTATADEETPLSLTNHAYFNLNGTLRQAQGPGWLSLSKPSLRPQESGILDHILTLDCEKVLEISGDMIPTSIINVENTPFDFRKPKKVGRDIKKLTSGAGGYDHCFVTKADESEVVKVGTLESEKSGIKMEVFTNQRGIQIYTGNFLDGIIGKGGIVQKKHDGICLETERFPNAVNRNDFPSCILKAGDVFKSITEFRYILKNHELTRINTNIKNNSWKLV